MIKNAQLKAGLNARELFDKVMEISVNNDCHEYCRILLLPYNISDDDDVTGSFIVFASVCLKNNFIIFYQMRF